MGTSDELASACMLTLCSSSSLSHCCDLSWLTHPCSVWTDSLCGVLVVSSCLTHTLLSVLV